MYKKQLIFQKIVCMAMLIMSAVIFIYSLGIMTDIFDSLYSAYDPELGTEKVSGSALYYEMQPFNGYFTNLSIGLIIVTLILFFTCTHSRRKYYIGNYIAVGISSVCNVAFTVWALSNISYYKALYLQVDFAGLREYLEKRNKLNMYTDSTFWFDVGYVIFGVLLFVTVLLIVNTIFKVLLMKEEKRLIGSRKDVKA